MGNAEAYTVDFSTDYAKFCKSDAIVCPFYAQQRKACLCTSHPLQVGQTREHCMSKLMQNFLIAPF